MCVWVCLWVWRCLCVWVYVKGMGVSLAKNASLMAQVQLKALLTPLHCPSPFSSKPKPHCSLTFPCKCSRYITSSHKLYPHLPRPPQALLPIHTPLPPSSTHTSCTGTASLLTITPPAPPPPPPPAPPRAAPREKARLPLGWTYTSTQPLVTNPFGGRMNLALKTVATESAWLSECPF